jgi:hypothetical protein
LVETGDEAGSGAEHKEKVEEEKVEEEHDERDHHQPQTVQRRCRDENMN